MNKLSTVPVGVYEKALPSTMTWPERLAAAAQAGYDFVEISIDESEARLARLEWGPAERAELREAIAGTGVALTSMCLSAHRKYPLGSASAKTRQTALDILRKAISFAQDVGVRIVQVAGYDVFYEPSNAGTRERFLDGLHQGVIWASGGGVMLALENVDQYVTSITQAMWYVNQLNSPWFQIYADIGNLAAMGHDVIGELEVGTNHLVGVHIKDTLAGQVRRVPFGQGTVPFAKAFHKLSNIGFSGPILIEMWTDDAPDALEIISTARSWIQARLEETSLSN
jgi:L-ribulose-5-phosphate 3-epimerase